MAAETQSGMEQLLALARRLVSDLESLGGTSIGDQGFAVRLAQAHAWGLVDQLDDIVVGRNSTAPALVSALAPMDTPRRS